MTLYLPIQTLCIIGLKSLCGKIDIYLFFLLFFLLRSGHLPIFLLRSGRRLHLHMKKHKNFINISTSDPTSWTVTKCLQFPRSSFLILSSPISCLVYHLLGGFANWIKGNYYLNGFTFGLRCTLYIIYASIIYFYEIVSRSLPGDFAFHSKVRNWIGYPKKIKGKTIIICVEMVRRSSLLG